MKQIREEWEERKKEQQQDTGKRKREGTTLMAKAESTARMERTRIPNKTRRRKGSRCSSVDGNRLIGQNQTAPQSGVAQEMEQQKPADTTGRTYGSNGTEQLLWTRQKYDKPTGLQLHCQGVPSNTHSLTTSRSHQRCHTVKSQSEINTGKVSSK
jgi:hypothetical protein